MKDISAIDSEGLALAAIGWVLSEPDRASRFLALTGLDPDGLRATIAAPATLASVIGFLESHEPDLIACADATGTSPATLVRAREVLER